MSSSNTATKVFHRFLRQPNLNSSIYSRAGNRFNPFQNTLTLLKDPATQRELYLIGTTNSSNLLAFRTKKLIEKVQPTDIYTQAHPDWWSVTKTLDIKSQGQLTEISEHLPRQKYQFENHLRGILWRLRLGLWKTSIDSISRFPSDFRPFHPGYETKVALHAAEAAGAKLHFGGTQFDNITVQALRLEPDLYPWVCLWRMRKFMSSFSAWKTDYNDFYNILHARGGEAFAQSVDRSRINLMVQMFSKIAPKQKAILVDQRDERLFRDIYALKGKRIVAVVNQWHMQGVQTHWQRATNTVPAMEHLSPIADMDIDQYQETDLVNEFLREFTSEITHSEPATHQNYLLSYHKENFEYERTRHTHHNSHEDIPEPGQKHHHKH